MSRVASKPLSIVAGFLAAAGVGLAVFAPPAPKPVEGLGSIAIELDAKLRETAVGAHARADTLANLPSMKTSVSTDAGTVRNQTQTELAFRTNPGEIITIAQVPKTGDPMVLLVLPEGSPPEGDVAREGQRAEIAGGKLRVGDVLSITPQYRADELRGALGVSWPIDLASVTQKLDAIGAAAKIEVGTQVITIGAHPLAEGDETQPLALASELGKGVHATLHLRKAVTPPPLRPIGLGVAGLALLLGVVGLRGGGRQQTPSEPPMAETQLPTPVPGMTRSPAPGTNAGAEEIGVGSILQDTYEVTQLLGVGGMGKVWEAQHRRLPDKKVAIKLLSGQSVQDELFARFRREAEVTSKLGHPNIIGVIDFNTLPTGAPYIVLELLKGESLATRLARGPLSLPAALEITRQIGSALDAAHHAQIVHRDLKPDNVFLVPTEINGVKGELVKVLDFGISKMQSAVGAQTQDSLVFGTPQYMSPEQASGRNSEVDARSDVWALGAMVYEMLTGELAFPGEALATVVAQIIVMPSPSLREVGGFPPHVVDAIDRSLAKAPADRFQDMRSFVAALTGAPLTQTRPVA